VGGRGIGVGNGAKKLELKEKGCREKESSNRSPRGQREFQSHRKFPSSPRRERRTTFRVEWKRGVEGCESFKKNCGTKGEWVFSHTAPTATLESTDRKTDGGRWRLTGKRALRRKQCDGVNWIEIDHEGKNRKKVEKS